MVQSFFLQRFNEYARVNLINAIKPAPQSIRGVHKRSEMHGSSYQTAHAAHLTRHPQRSTRLACNCPGSPSVPLQQSLKAHGLLVLRLRRLRLHGMHGLKPIHLCNFQNERIKSHSNLKSELHAIEPI